MDAFESLVGELLWHEGYWVQNSVKVELTKDEKIAVGRPSSPRWEIDIVAYSGRRNELLAVECKSYLDSLGVQFRAFNGGNAKLANRFKLFNDKTLRHVVFKRLRHQLYEAGLINRRNTPLKLALVCGKIVRDRDRALLKKHFKRNRWRLWDDVWLREKLQNLSEGGYENSSVAVASKLLLRD